MNAVPTLLLTAREAARMADEHYLMVTEDLMAKAVSIAARGDAASCNVPHANNVGMELS